MIVLTVEEQINNAIIWIENLPDYPQIQNGELEDDAGFCCLGVANKLLAMSNYGNGTYVNLLPTFGLLDELGEAKDLSLEQNTCFLMETVQLAWYNDGGADFFEIQDLLSSHPENFFEPDVAEGIRKHFEQNEV